VTQDTDWIERFDRMNRRIKIFLNEPWNHENAQSEEDGGRDDFDVCVARLNEGIRKE